MRRFSWVRAGCAPEAHGGPTCPANARRWLSFLPLKLVAILLVVAFSAPVLPFRFLAPAALAATSQSAVASTLADGPDSAESADAPSPDDAAAPDDASQADPAPQADDAPEADPTTPADNVAIDPRAGAQPTVSSRGGARPATVSLGDQIAAIARQFEGAPYRWAGASPAGFDCSGFSMYVYGRAGISIPRSLGGQLNSGRQVGIDELKPGDIVFFQNTYSAGLSHSGIYLGDNQFINAETEWAGVVTRSLRGTQWEGDFVGGSRPYENN